MLTMPLHRQIKTESLALVADNRSLTPGDKEVGELLGIIEDKIMQDIAERRL